MKTSSFEEDNVNLKGLNFDLYTLIFLYFFFASSSVNPTHAKFGLEKTAVGIFE